MLEYLCFCIKARVRNNGIMEKEEEGGKRNSESWWKLAHFRAWDFGTAG